MGKRSMLILLCFVFIFTVGLAYGEFFSGEKPLPTAVSQQREGERTEEVMVYVSGAVKQPGVVSLASSARVGTAIESCGGFLPTADQQAVNLAQKITDGQQIRVPERGAGAEPVSQGQSDGRINLNTADEKQLDSLPGIGPAMAQRILEYRKSQGNFQNIEDLKKVKGIGAAKFEKLKDKVSL